MDLFSEGLLVGSVETGNSEGVLAINNKASAWHFSVFVKVHHNLASENSSIIETTLEVTNARY